MTDLCVVLHDENDREQSKRGPDKNSKKKIPINSHPKTLLRFHGLFDVVVTADNDLNLILILFFVEQLFPDDH